MRILMSRISSQPIRSEPLRNGHLADLDLHATALRNAASQLQDMIEADPENPAVSKLCENVQEIAKQYNKAAGTIKKKIVLYLN